MKSVFMIHTDYSDVIVTAAALIVSAKTKHLYRKRKCSSSNSSSTIRRWCGEGEYLTPYDFSELTKGIGEGRWGRIGLA